jgi:hypothetical protein
VQPERTHDGHQRRAGAATNISIQIRYCTATTTDKPFGKMPQPIRLPVLPLGLCEKFT